MQTPCIAVLDTARDLLDFGMIGEGADNLVALRRCAHRLGCADWRDCRCRVERTWQDGSTPNRVARARRAMPRR